jgi:hypothetical protein
MTIIFATAVPWTNVLYHYKKTETTRIHNEPKTRLEAAPPPPTTTTHPLDLLPGDGALGPARPLLGVLVNKLATCTKPINTNLEHSTDQETEKKELPKRAGMDRRRRPHLGS